MESKDKTPSKSDEGAFWRECRVCVESNTRSPGFRSFVALLDHLLEHQAGRDREPISVLLDPRTGKVMESLDQEETEGFQPKVSPYHRAVLPLISWWLQQALGDLDVSSAQGLPVAERLQEFVMQLPEERTDQREYLLTYSDQLSAVAMTKTGR